ncbi:hypothetical protein CARUB_v10028671mg, partial [Capsella rubella]
SVLSLDLHTLEFRDVPTPPLFYQTGRLSNPEDRLVLAIIDTSIHSQLITQHQDPWNSWKMWFIPVAVSKGGNLFLCNDRKQLYKYYPKIGLLRHMMGLYYRIGPYDRCYLF